MAECRVRLARADLVGATEGRANRRRCRSRPPSTSATTRYTCLPTKRSLQNARRTMPASPAPTRRSSTTSHTWPADNMAPQRLWKGGLRARAWAVRRPCRVGRPRLRGVWGQSASPPHPSGRGEVGVAARRPACNHAGAPHCRRRVRGSPGTTRTPGPPHQAHPGRLPSRQPRTSGEEWRAPNNRPCGASAQATRRGRTRRRSTT